MVVVVSTGTVVVVPVPDPDPDPVALLERQVVLAAQINGDNSEARILMNKTHRKNQRQKQRFAPWLRSNPARLLRGWCLYMEMRSYEGLSRKGAPAG